MQGHYEQAMQQSLQVLLLDESSWQDLELDTG